MPQYIVSRLFQSIIALLVLVTLVFVLARVIGSPVDLMLPSDATQADREALVHRLGLDQPAYVQYFEYMQDLATGDLGYSLTYSRPITALFFEVFPNTLRLALVAMGFAIVFGFAMGIASGTHRGSIVDRAVRAFSVIGMSAPSFWVGLVLILIFSVHLKLLPVARMGGPSSYILPGFTLSLFILAGIARLVRSSMIEVLDSDYVKLARIKGVHPNVIIWKHCLRNALLPVITFTGVQIAFLFNGSVVIESVFAWPGVGRLIYQGITGRDYPLVQGCLLAVGFLIIVINLAVDFLYAYVDPRIRLGGPTAR